MLISVKWLEEILGTNLDIDRLPYVALTLGMEIEQQNRCAPADAVIGRVKGITPHPALPNLDLLEISTNRAVRIVSAAKNVRIGDRVLVVPAGAVFNGNPVQEKGFAGARSDGLLVSEQELGLAEKSTGVIVLDRGEEGKPFARYFDDLVVEIKSFPNRPDWLSMTGVARELAVGFGIAYQPQSVRAGQPNRNGNFSVQVRDKKGCPRYTARIFSDVRVAESPFSVKWRLHAMGMKSINNIVDATNITMLLTGQPLHPFDLDCLKGGIVVRRARKNEEFVTLEGTVLKLSTKDLVIADLEGTIALAGIIGGRGSEISPATTRVLLESAVFHPDLIAHTARRLGLRTEASVRFEEGADLAAVDEVSRLTGECFQRLGPVREEEYIALGKKATPRTVKVTTGRLNERLALRLNDRQVKDILKKAQINASGRGTLRVKLPHYRRDLQIEEDLYEEVARIYGYMNIPERPQQKWVASTLIPEKNRRYEEAVRNFLAGRGFHEAYTLSLVAAKRLDDLGYEGYVRVKNPLNERFDALRPGLLPGLVDAVNFNLSKGNRSLQLFEIGNALQAAEPFQEKRLGVILGGEKNPGYWQDTEKYLEYYDAKGTAEAIFELFHIAPIDFKPKAIKGLEYAVAIIASGTELGYLGSLSRDLVAGQFYIFELTLDRLWPFIAEPFYIPPGRYPANTRDLSFLVGEEVAVPEVIGLVRKVGGPVLEDISLFDYYRGKNIPSGKKSYGFRLYFRAPDRTLTDLEVDSFVRKIVDEVVSNYRAQLRGKEADWTNS